MSEPTVAACLTRLFSAVVVVLFSLTVGRDALLAEDSAAAAPESRSVARSRSVLSHALPRLEGTRLELSAIEVSYGPGESSPAHSHPCPVLGYVVRGALRMQVEGEAESVYRAGEAFYEAPGRAHLVSANASAEESALFLAIFVCDQDAPLSSPLAAPRASDKEQP